MCHAQKAEYGVFLGASYYLGELNASRHFVDVASPSVGILYRNNFNARYSLRFNGMYGKLTGSDRLFDIGLNNFRNLSFESDVFEAAMMLEFNFFAYGFKSDEKRFTPYVQVGISAFRVEPEVNSFEETPETANAESFVAPAVTSIAMPFGFGMRWMLGGGINMSVEWTMRKTFNDKLDGINNQYEIGNVYNEPVQFKHLIGFQKGNPTNNDWYSTAGIILSYRIGPKKNRCPALD